MKTELKHAEEDIFLCLDFTFEEEEYLSSYPERLCFKLSSVTLEYWHFENTYGEIITPDPTTVFEMCKQARNEKIWESLYREHEGSFCYEN